MEIKHCNKCGKDKPISEFGKNKSKKDGLQTMCKGCVRAYGKLHYATHIRKITLIEIGHIGSTTENG